MKPFTTTFLLCSVFAAQHNFNPNVNRVSSLPITAAEIPAYKRIRDDALQAGWRDIFINGKGVLPPEKQKFSKYHKAISVYFAEANKRIKIMTKGGKFVGEGVYWTLVVNNNASSSVNKLWHSLPI
jgi:hypothetical protein